MAYPTVGQKALARSPQRRESGGMTDLIKTSKFLSQHLRHRPEAIGIVLERGGWVGVDALLTACARHGHPISREQLGQVVQQDSKRRFSYDETGERLRANQGHTTAVELEFEVVTPPALLYHGTATRFLPDILASGLSRMNRHHVHLSGDLDTAAKVGRRHGQLALLDVQARAMSQAGLIFYRSANGVWLTDSVPVEFLRLHVSQ
ncbi:RNA 2'-phosphotransferase [Deinococcus sp. UYEF24]